MELYENVVNICAQKENFFFPNTLNKHVDVEHRTLLLEFCMLI